MTMKTAPNLGIKYGWDLGEDGWNTGMDGSLALLDHIVHLGVLSMAETDPPVGPAEGDRYLVAAGGTGDWDTHDGEIAIFFETEWAFVTPLAGASLYDSDTDKTWRFDGTLWKALPTEADVTAEISAAISGITFDGETARDVIALALTAGANITITPNDGADTITIAVSGLDSGDISDFAAAVNALIAAAGSYTDEDARDALGAALTAGAGITVTVNDGADTITIASSITQYTDEMARDALGTALTAGAGITITPNDGADTIAIVSSITQYTDEMARDAIAAMIADSSTIDVTYNDGADTFAIDVIQTALKPTETLIIACSDEATAITAGTGKVTFRMPYAFTLTAVRASVTTAPTGSTILIDINESGVTILSTKLMIDATEKTSTTAATPAVISDASLADDAEMTIDFDQVGSTIAGAGVKVYLIGHRT